MAIHTIYTNDDASRAARTLCGLRGTPAGENTYKTAQGTFTAVMPDNLRLGMTCAKCKQVATVMRTQGKKAFALG